MADLTEIRAMLDNGHLQEATGALLAVIQQSPDDAAALGLLGRAMLETGQPLAAAATLERAVHSGDRDPQTLRAAALALEAAGDRRLAEELLRDATAIDADWALFLSDLLVRSGRPAEASSLLESRTDPYGRLHRAHALLAEGHDADAHELHAAAVAEEPAVKARHAAIVNELSFVGLHDDARAILGLALELDSDDGELLHLQATYEGTVVDRANDGYIEAVFDRFARTFETRLRSVLGYRVPEDLDGLLEAELGPADGTLDILDLGCGTGLLGEVVMPRARSLDGIDLSAKMLERAARGRRYQRLVKGEILAVLPMLQQRYDVVLAADVLIYFGALAPVFASVAEVLHPSGRWAFSLEDGTEPVALRSTGRFAHGLEATERALIEAGFAIKDVRETVIRVERAEPIAGHLVLAQLGPS